MSRPIVKWAGGKTRLLPELVKRMPLDFDTYHEPFAGGAALFFDQWPMFAYLNDSNQALMDTYVAVARGDITLLVDLLKEHEAHHRREYYDSVRFTFNERPPCTIEQTAAMFIYLNKTCFNGLWRVNSKGAFNVPMGRQAKSNICDEGALHSARAALQNTELLCGDYAAACASVCERDFVYFDSPYDGGFVGYTASGFGEDEQRCLAAIARDLSARGAFVMLSNADTPLIRELYRDPHQHQYGWYLDAATCGRSVGGRGASRAAAQELIIRNYK